LNKKVAIKRLTKAFDEETSDQDIKKKLLKLTYREIKLLKHVNHVNVIKIIDIFTKSENSQNLNEM
jgi:serine/threonine protein kinase